MILVARRWCTRKKLCGEGGSDGCLFTAERRRVGDKAISSFLFLLVRLLSLVVFSPPSSVGVLRDIYVVFACVPSFLKESNKHFFFHR